MGSLGPSPGAGVGPLFISSVVGVGGAVSHFEAVVDVVLAVSFGHARGEAGLDRVAQRVDLVGVERGWCGRVRDHLFEPTGGVGGSIKLEGDEEPQVLFGGEVTEQRKVGDEAAGLLVGKDVVNARTVIPRGAAVPVHTGSEGARAFVRVPSGEVVPACREDFGQEGRVLDVHLGVGADKVGDISDSLGGLPGLLKKGSVVSARFGIKGSDVLTNCDVRAVSSAAWSPFWGPW